MKLSSFTVFSYDDSCYMVFAYGRSLATTTICDDGISALYVELYKVFIFDSLTYADTVFGAIAGVLSFLAKRVPLDEFRPTR